MWVQRAYKSELAWTDRQVRACKGHAGAARWAYNWGLQVKQERYRATKKSPTAYDLHRELNALKKTEIPWMYEVSKCALKKQGKWKGKLGYPRFKTKKKGPGSFRLTGSLVVSAEAIMLPHLGRLRLKERGYLPIGDVGFYEFKRQLLYKAAWYGAQVMLAGRWEPSSKTCSGCGWVDAELTLSTRTFACPCCGLVLDRDLNAAINLEQLADSSPDSLNARCELPALARSPRLA